MAGPLRTRSRPAPPLTIDRDTPEEQTTAAQGGPLGGLAAELAIGLVRRRAAGLTVGAADDPEEGAADDLARRMLGSEEESCGCSSGGGEPCTCPPRGDGTIRRKPAGAPTSVAPRDLALSGGQPLSHGDRRFFEARTGADLSGVRLHDNTGTAAAARQIGALAFTRGSDIGFAAGAYRRDNPTGRSLLAHELAHVVLGHSAIRRREDSDFAAEHEFAEQRRMEEAERKRRHQAWVGGAEEHRLRDLPEQSKTIAAERERIGMALLAQQSAAIDAAAAGQGWLMSEMSAKGYAGPGLAEIKQAWGNALVAAASVRPPRPGEPPSPEAKVVALEAVPVFYDALDAFATAAEAAQHAHVTSINTRLRNEYQAALDRYNERKRADEITVRGTAGDLGAGGFRGGLALSRGAPPREPTYLSEPPAISGKVAAARARLYAADSVEQWDEIARDVEGLAAGFSKLIVSSLPVESEVRRGAQYLEELGGRLEAFEKEQPSAVRIPAIFYPLDKVVEQPGKPVVVEAIPWQFYLVNTRLTPPGQQLKPDGEWQLIDLTSTKRFVNTTSASDADTARLQRGDKVDPPVGLFGELNSKLRFPEGRLYFVMPSGQPYVLETTEPWEWSDFLTAIGVALAAIALVAAVIATGGAAAPAAVAFYAGLGAAAAGIGSTLAGMHEKSKHGILTGKDVDEAMISIGIDLLNIVSLGVSRLVTLPAAAARLGMTGTRFVVLQRAALAVKTGVVAADVYQAWSFTTGFLSALNALEADTRLTAEERKRMRGQLVRRALLTGALLAVSLKGDVQDAVRAGRTLRIAHVENDGSLVVRPDTEPALHPHPSTGHPDVAPHAQVQGPVHRTADRTGAAIKVGPQSHGLAVAGRGRTRDLYFCSDVCTPIVHKLEAILATLPENHPLWGIVRDMLRRARGGQRGLRRGTMTPEAGDELASQIAADIARHSRQDEMFAALVNTDAAVLRSRAAEIRRRLARDVSAQELALSEQAQRQKANRGMRTGDDPETLARARSPIETDILGGLGIEVVKRPSRGAQKLEWDTGNFSHTYAEALVPGLPRGLAAEVHVTLPDGSVGRADRVQFIYDRTGTVIGAHVYEIKPNTPENLARGQQQANDYAAGLRAKIEGDLRAAGKPIPTTAEDGSPLYATHVVPYDQERMMAVLRAIRMGKSDAADMARLEAIARAVFSGG
jgi:hypothetical protein